MPRRDRLALLLLAVLWAAMSLAVHPVGGFATNDDWVYAQAVRSILDTGRFALSMPATANVYAQAWWGALFCWPLGFSFSALRASTLVLALAGVWALYLLVREIGAGRRLAFLAAASLIVNPLYFGLAHSFMTDVPFLGVALLSLWLFVRGLQRRSGWSLAAAFTLALMALLIRQFGVVLPLAYAVALLLRDGFGRRSVALALLPLAGAVALQLAFQHWMIATGRTPLLVLGGSVADLRPLLDPAHWRNIAARGVTGLPYIGLGAAPVLLTVLPARAGALAAPLRWWVGLAAVELAGLIVAGVYIVGAPMPGFGNVLIPSGFGPLTLRDTFLLGRNLPTIPGWLSLAWTALTVFGSAAAAVGLLLLGEAAVAAFRTRHFLPGLLVALILGYIALLAGVGVTTALFDRYLLLFPPALFALVAWRTPHLKLRADPAGIAALALLLGSGVVSLAVTHDYLAWNRARWTATRALLDSGISAHSIDGGYEFNGWYTSRPDYKMAAPKSYWWIDDDRFVIASGPLDGYRERRRYSFSHWLLQRKMAVLVLERAGGAP